MSKSKGNGIDPVELIDLYGADALRFALMREAGMRQDIRFKPVKEGRQEQVEQAQKLRQQDLEREPLRDDEPRRVLPPDPR